jgi:tetratricopeptide (TPR) repeat protein
MLLGAAEIVSRTAWYKAFYFGLIIVASVALFAAYMRLKPPLPVVLLVLVALLAPSRVQGWYWRDFFRGRRLLAAGDGQSAAVHFERFMEQLRLRPGLRRLIWLNAAIYTRDAEAMTLNNLGAARLQLGDLPGAQSAFEDARRLDPQSPLPLYNLALLAQVEGRDEEAAQLLALARRMGYSRATSDRLVSAAGALLACIEGLGSSAPPSGHCIHCGCNLIGNTSGRCPECGYQVRHASPPSAP